MMGERESTMTMSQPTARFGSFFDAIGPALHAALRIGVGLLFMQHGLQKLFGLLGGVDGQGGTAPLGSLMGVAGILEFVGGLLILIGFLTRPVALILAGEMVVAYAMAHLPQGWVPIQNQGELALLYALSFAFLFGNGAGPLSVDDAIGRRRETGVATGERPRRVAEPSTREGGVPERKERRRDSAA